MNETSSEKSGEGVVALPQSRSRKSKAKIVLFILVPFLILGAVGGYAFKIISDLQFQKDVRRIASRPDVSVQMCRNDNHLVTYGIYREFRAFAARDYRFLRQDRKRAISTIRSLLKEEFSKLSPLSEAQNTHGFKLDELRIGSYCAFLVDLNVSEALPELLEYEQQLRPFISLKEPPADRPHRSIIEIERPAEESDAYVYAYLITTMLAILHQEQYAEVLASDLHAEFKERIAQWNDNWPLVYPMQEFHALTNERRDQVVKWTENYLETVPPSKRLGVKGMIPNKEPR